MAPKSKAKTKRGTRSDSADLKRLRIRLAFRVLTLWHEEGFPKDYEFLAIASVAYLESIGKVVR